LVSHWLQFKTDQPFIPNLDKFGFVYLITNTKTEKAYVGCKQYYIGKAKKESKWQTYMGSSKYLKDDIKKIGKKHFKFEVIAEYINKRSLRYYEAHYQMKWDVLTAVIEGTDEPAFYNSYVGGKFYRPVESYQDPEWIRKISEAKIGDKNPFYGKKHTEEAKKKLRDINSGEKHPQHKGKAEFYLDGKLMKVPCLSVWCKENGYKTGYFSQIAETTENGFFIHATRGKQKALSLKGPLGTITKVRWLRKEEINGN
jgi:group I intron endonuclease